MFIGEYHFNLDDKNRIFIPTEFRSLLKDKLIINRGIERCLFVYPNDEWNKVVNKLNTLSFTKKVNREFSRMFMSGAYYKEMDSQGRVTIDKLLVEYAGLSKECVIIGVGERIEIWDKKAWLEYYQERQATLDEISERIDFDD
ncbi:MAG TPA: division/cell wall cluster transcriptional repressor MraZ [Bacilli bacterium]|jgi:MraZ protein|nr:division/cell wall cluster transcriptional repressor MraZ [Bacilli bacterium]HNZ73851.1 division/cell wall cluster transcriptional repressor MraZ [Bacilli bacterium]HOC97668.1 division/cell wall cluster transcriptional repressor MraZ [Bacilli bacterium]HOF43102.1 division/cell wall cluster transcriptional repressor MraZ [Bacilli bacterium]HOR53519.1 division/cell wall cluster transcriptional repressor MraZ [Bacilli bacterium]